jgi:hypothetical protein
MIKRKQNIQIAKILGFVIKEDGQVIYPNDWYDEVKAIPIKTIPDFVGMLEGYRKLADGFKYGIPTDFKAVKEYLENEK